MKKGLLDFGWMQYPYTYIDISCTNEQVSEVQVFAEAVYEKRKKVYEKRGQADKLTIINQIVTSKCFEFMVYNHVKTEIGPEMTVEPPSLKIYGKYTTFDNDLDIKSSLGSVGVHIKSQDIQRINASFPISWAFQKIDCLFKKKECDILILGIYRDKNEGMILAKDSVYKFKEHLKPAVLSRLSDKEFLYYDVNQPAFNMDS